MKPQLTLFFLLFSFLFYECSKNLPDAPTIIQGKIVDENENPIEGIEIYFYDIRYKGISPTTTFDISTKTDKNGYYVLSQLISKNTGNHLELFMNDNEKYKKSIEIKGKYQYFEGPLILNSNNFIITFGKTNLFNFKFTHRNA